MRHAILGNRKGGGQSRTGMKARGGNNNNNNDGNSSRNQTSTVKEKLLEIDRLIHVDNMSEAAILMLVT